jgi:AraC family transcriptional regulator
MAGMPVGFGTCAPLPDRTSDQNRRPEFWYRSSRKEGGVSEWNLNVQRIIDLVERNLRGELTLEDVSRRLGYSPWYCTRQFSRVMGMSLRSYLRLRRLSEAVAALRDGDRGILEVAIEFGFSSQEAFTRAFKAAWGMAPGAWRSHPRPLELMTRRYAVTLSAEGGSMETNPKVEKIEISIQAVPARRFIGIKAEGATDYFDFWAKLEGSEWDCQRVDGILASLTANAQIGGWYEENGKKGYLYGVEVPVGYPGPVPDGMVMMDIPATEYVVFRHPPYDFDSQDAAVWKAIRKAVASYDPRTAGYEWDPAIPMWQRHDAAGMGQAWCRAVRKR